MFIFRIFLFIYPLPCIKLQYLDVGRVQHNSHRSTESLGGQVLDEVGSDQAVVAVGSGNLTPDHSDLRATDLLLGSVNVGNSLAQVELGVLGSVNTLNLDQGDVGVGHALGTLVRDVLTLNVHCIVSILLEVVAIAWAPSNGPTCFRSPVKNFHSGRHTRGNGGSQGRQVHQGSRDRYQAGNGGNNVHL